ncbi:hypothetical protein GBA52_006932 [Prunus armeniaca]|nr:hypothetical protein GBA52_006932 [Prunus armeniaca]
MGQQFGPELTCFDISGRSEKVNKKAVSFPLHLRISVTFQSWVLPLTICSQLQASSHFIFTKMIDDQGLGIVANLLGIFIFLLTQNMRATETGIVCAKMKRPYVTPGNIEKTL